MRLIRLIALFVLVFRTPLSAAIPTCFFCPPDKWQLADPDAYSPLVKVGFVGPAFQGFCPSINLAIEKVDCSLRDYLEAVKKIHKINRHKDWSYLGTFTTLAGEAALTQIDLTSPSGPMRMLQLIFLKEGTAYILTAAALKKEFKQLLPTLRKTFHSLQITDDLYNVIQNNAQCLQAKKLYSQAEKIVREYHHFSPEMPEWQTFQDFIVTNFSDLGPYWQALTVAEGYQQLEALITASPGVVVQKDTTSEENKISDNKTIEKADQSIAACIASVEMSLALIKEQLDQLARTLSE